MGRELETHGAHTGRAESSARFGWAAVAPLDSSNALFAGEREIPEAELGRCRLGLGGGQGWGAGREAHAVQDGANGLRGLDRRGQTKPPSTPGTSKDIGGPKKGFRSGR